MLVEHVPQLAVGDLFGSADLTGAGVVDQHVDLSECIDGALHHGDCGCRVPHVMGNGQEPVPVASRQPGKPLNSPSGSDHPLPCPQRGLRQRQSQARTRTGDDPRSVLCCHDRDARRSSALEGNRQTRHARR